MLRRALVLAALASLPAAAFAVSSVFVYQGELRENNARANGSYDLQFALQTSAGVPVGAPLLHEAVPVADGRFSVELDFGASITGADFQLQIGVRPDASNGAFTPLLPATALRPTPQAQVAGRADQATSVVASSILSTSIVDGSILAADVDASQIQRRVQASCAAGESIRAINPDGSVLCNAAAIYGDGSRGDLNISSGLNFLNSGNLQFNNITVAAGASLFVPSGATIKALGSVTIHGFLNVQPGAQPASQVLAGDSQPSLVGPNYFGNAANSGGSDNSTTSGGLVITLQGRTGAGAPAPRLIQSTPAHLAIRPTYVGGGAGGHGSSGGGGQGGGFAAIIARGPISVSASGAVNAGGSPGNSNSGAGGGGGGILVLASRTSITNAGTINSSGGNGANGGTIDSFNFVTAWGAGGGGGGGIVHLIAPSVSAGTVLVAGGTPGSVPGPTTFAGAVDLTSTGGGGGGACYGRGGNGSLVNGQTNTRQFTWATPGGLAPGDPGLLIQTLTDPTSLF